MEPGDMSAGPAGTMSTALYHPDPGEGSDARAHPRGV